MKSVFEYCESNILVIPQALHGMQDVEPLLLDDNVGFFYKCLQDDLLDIEFYSNFPCLVYIEKGQETITNADNQTLVLKENSAIFLPQGLNLHSDFVQSTESLKAHLVFLDQALITEFLSKAIHSHSQGKSGFSAIVCDSLIQSFFESIKEIKSQRRCSKGLVRVKLLELLHLLELSEPNLVSYLIESTQNTSTPKRNLSRLLSTSDILKLSINDMAHLSGRSLSTFLRDFKALYDTTPKKWLQEKRLLKAKDLLSDTDLSVTHIANEIGYDNVSHFISAFKTRYDITPKQLKKQL